MFEKEECCIRVCLSIFFVALLVAAQPAFGQDSPESDEISSTVIDLGTISAQNPVVSYETSLDYPGDIDWFRLEVEEAMGLTISAIESGLDPGANFRLIVQDQNESYIDSGEISLQRALDPGSYLIQVDSGDLSTLDYVLVIGKNFETEPNDCVSEANNLGLLDRCIVLSGSIDPMADIDFYRFDVSSDTEGYANIFVPISDGIGTELVLYEYNKTEGLYLPIDLNEDQIVTYIGEGSYAVRVEGYSIYDTIPGYVLAIIFATVRCETEPNDDFEYAITLGALDKEGLLQEGCIFPYDDIDHYLFEINETAVVTIEVFGTASGDSYIALYDESEEEIDWDDDGGSEYWSLIERELTPGMYYVSVESSYWGGSEFQYSLAIEETSETP